MPYLLDTNVFIESRRRYYGMDFCPAFWDWLDQQNAAGNVFSVERVGVELSAGIDELVPWAAARGPTFFLPPDNDTVRSLAAVSTWASSGSYNPAAVTTFLDGADALLVAHAHAKGYTVVTHEVVQTTPNNIKIPNACVAMSVQYMNLFAMLRVEHARFVLGAAAATA